MERKLSSEIKRSIRMLKVYKLSTSTGRFAKELFFFFNYENRNNLKSCETFAWRFISSFSDKRRANRKKRRARWVIRVSHVQMLRGGKSPIFNGERAV